jgi:diguanylate cyclase (GGDEF)-like protein
MCLVFALEWGAAAQAAPDDDVVQLIKTADEIKTSDYSRFVALLKRLDSAYEKLGPNQQAHVRYLRGWRATFDRDYELAIPTLKAIADESSEDVTLRFRADVTLTNALGLAGHYEEAYRRLNQTLELQSLVPDRGARMLGFAVAAQLNTNAGQYDLAASYADRWIADESEDAGMCKAISLKIESLYRGDKLRVADPLVTKGIDACGKASEPMFANRMRSFMAGLAVANGRMDEAIKLVQAHYEEARQTHYALLMAEFDSILARSFLKIGDSAQARQYAQRAIDESTKNDVIKPVVEAYQVLYEVAKKSGDAPAALAYHEKYAAADKGYLTDTTARTLAYQIVNQQVMDKKHQIETLTEANQVLQLQQQVAEKSEETERLYLLLLGSVLGFIVLWAYRTKRSQMRFQKLARRDGLTGILNRQHFMDEAKAVLQHCEKSAREACMILVDFDNFKAVNDTHGHVAGDVVLQSAVAVLQVHMRVMDIFGRLGGEEFGILLPDCGLDTALQRAEVLRVAIAGLARSETGIDFDVSASFGVTTTIETGYDLRQMLIHADSALYRAKREGRNRVATFLATLVADPAQADSVASVTH